jgi:hypothetical protein
MFLDPLKGSLTNTGLKDIIFLFGAWYSTPIAATVSIFSDSQKSFMEMNGTGAVGKVGWRGIFHVCISIKVAESPVVQGTAGFLGTAHIPIQLPAENLLV